MDQLQQMVDLEVEHLLQVQLKIMQVQVIHLLQILLKDNLEVVDQTLLLTDQVVEVVELLIKDLMVIFSVVVLVDKVEMVLIMI